MAGDESTSGVAEIDAFIAEQGIDTGADGWRLRLPRPPQASFEEGRRYLWEASDQPGADLGAAAPGRGAHARIQHRLPPALGFYDRLSFHRVIEGFMAQGGCPEGTGTRGPGYQYDGEFDDAVRHDRPGLLSMANAGPGTDGSQFFLTFVETPWLDGKHTIFGEVEAGMETVGEIEKRGSRGGEPSEALRIDTASIRVE